MFIEKLQKEDFVSFIKEITNGKYFMIDGLFNVDSIKNFKYEDGVVSFKNRYLVFTFSDFSYRNSADVKRIIPQKEYNERWLRFMYLKFGDEYKKAFLFHRIQCKANAITDFASNYDKETKSYAERLSR